MAQVFNHFSLIHTTDICPPLWPILQLFLNGYHFSEIRKCVVKSASVCGVIKMMAVVHLVSTVIVFLNSDWLLEKCCG